MTNNPNIEDVTNSPKDWEDFWHSPEKYGTWQQQRPEDEVNQFTEVPIESNYVNDVLEGNSIICKRESPLSE